MATSFVKKTLKKAHGTLVERLVEKAHIRESEIHNSRLEEDNSILSYYSEPTSQGLASPRSPPNPTHKDRFGMSPYPNQWPTPEPGGQRGSIGKLPYPYSPTPGNSQQPLADSRYSPSDDPRFPQRSPDLRYSQHPPGYQDSRNPHRMHQPYQPHQPVELAQTEPWVAELPSSEVRHG
ncbi:MAG: hypothetical protein Q9185_004163 [Variospora sp. 1 TL-2023]